MTSGEHATKSHFPSMWFNPRDLGNIWQGGSFNPGGRSKLKREQADAVLAHELFHGYDHATGVSDMLTNDQMELRAWRFENVYRREAGLPSRDCYFQCEGKLKKYVLE